MSELDPKTQETLDVILTLVSERRMYASQQEALYKVMAKDQRDVGNKDQAAIYEASSVMFSRIEHEMNMLHAQISDMVAHQYGAEWEGRS